MTVTLRTRAGHTPWTLKASLMAASLLLSISAGCGAGNQRNVVDANSPELRSSGPRHSQRVDRTQSAQRKAQPSQSGNGHKKGHQKNAAHSSSDSSQKKASQGHGQKKGHEKQAAEGKKQEHCHAPGNGKGKGKSKDVCHSSANAVAASHH